MILLQCSHKMNYPAPQPRAEDIVYCRGCQDYSVVIGILALEKIKITTLPHIERIPIRSLSDTRRAG